MRAFPNVQAVNTALEEDGGFADLSAHADFEFSGLEPGFLHLRYVEGYKAVQGGQNLGLGRVPGQRIEVFMILFEGLEDSVGNLIQTGLPLGRGFTIEG